EFEQGYMLSGLPAFLLNIAQAYRMEGETTKAAEYYKRFLQKAEPDDPAREGAEKILAEIEGGNPPEPGKPPEPGRPPQVSGPPPPATDSGLTQDEIKGKLGVEYTRYLTSGLTLDAYERRKKALTVSWVGLGATV